MKVKELIQRLQSINPEAEALVCLDDEWGVVNKNVALIVGTPGQINGSAEFSPYTPEELLDNDKMYCMIMASQIACGGRI